MRAISKISSKAGPSIRESDREFAQDFKARPDAAASLRPQWQFLPHAALCSRPRRPLKRRVHRRAEP